MQLDPADYTDPERVIRWLDIDPSFDADWEGWSTLRTYAYVPGLRAMLNAIAPINYSKIANVGSILQDDLHRSHNYRGLIKNENLTVEQLKFLLGASKTDAGRLKPMRLDKALLGLYAINYEMTRQGHPAVTPRIVLSAFNLRGVSRRFVDLDRAAKEAVRIELAEAIDQSAQLASDFLKGSKVSIDTALRAHEHLSKRPEFRRSLSSRVEDCLETPTQRHTPASQQEDLTRGRFDELPAPYHRP